MQKQFDFSIYESLESAQTAPIDVLRDAANALAKSNGSKVSARVFTGGISTPTVYRHTFYLRAPSLDDFTDPLFYVWHGPELYPCNVLMTGDDIRNKVVCANDGELHDAVQDCLTSREAQQRIIALRAQVGH